MKKQALLVAVAGVTALSAGLTACGAEEVDLRTATPEQIATTSDDPWKVEQSVKRDRAEGQLTDGVYVGFGRGMEGGITVTLEIADNHIQCIAMTQDGETPSFGGYEAIRDGVYAQMINDCQGADIDTISGATITTAGVREAVTNALSQARA